MFESNPRSRLCSCSKMVSFFYPSLKLLFFYFPIFHVFKLFVRLVTVLRIVTLTFDLAKWLLFATYCLVMIIIYAKLFSNPTMHNKAMGRTRTGLTEVYAPNLSADCDLDLKSSETILKTDLVDAKITRGLSAHLHMYQPFWNFASVCDIVC